jgi:hypothetical protein
LWLSERLVSNRPPAPTKPGWALKVPEAHGRNGKASAPFLVGTRGWGGAEAVVDTIGEVAG